MRLGSRHSFPQVHLFQSGAIFGETINEMKFNDLYQDI